MLGVWSPLFAFVFYPLDHIYQKQIIAAKIVCKMANNSTINERWLNLIPRAFSLPLLARNEPPHVAKMSDYFTPTTCRESDSWRPNEIQA